ncbi:dethiobiotin synthase [Mucilaginibacter sp. Bleaf8]|uniref:dethiobiotin synthase n=1 Tax=Mucilaginibacter sp. Bleaf8 TaxID=2834430 RepID=UPI001BCF51DD|nr:dethiobiotin synthase [Mucilaginibacter sp. Bleaf8]MBS7563161.1 dethiobiotin synthase [Mucilaginibacter sp. Bleaf8]
MPANTPIFVTGIGTDVGKTVASAILVEHLKADYWKPVQSGDLDNSDTMKVQRLITNTVTRFHPEAYRLTQPFSPHKSADLDRTEIELDKIILPETDNQLLIEGAGGLMVPLNDKAFIIDLIEHLGAEAILVVKHYLGSINHTLLSMELLKKRNIKIRALVLNGDGDAYSEDIINTYMPIGKIVRIPALASVDKATVLKYSGLIEF